MSCRCCCCERERAERHASIRNAELARLKSRSLLTRETRRFAWLPISCPKSGGVFWLCRVRITEKEEISDIWVGFFMPAMLWRVTGVKRIGELS